MKWNGPSRLSKNLAADVANAIRGRVERIADVPRNSSLDRLPVDLGDTYEACVEYITLIDKLLSMPEPWRKERVLNLLGEIYRVMYIHLPYHQKHLSRGLKSLTVVLEPNSRKREAFADRRLRKTLSEANKTMKNLAKRE